MPIPCPFLPSRHALPHIFHSPRPSTGRFTLHLTTSSTGTQLRHVHLLHSILELFFFNTNDEQRQRPQHILPFFSPASSLFSSSGTKRTPPCYCSLTPVPVPPRSEIFPILYSTQEQEQQQKEKWLRKNYDDKNITNTRRSISPKNIRRLIVVLISVETTMDE